MVADVGDDVAAGASTQAQAAAAGAAVSVTASSSSTAPPPSSSLPSSPQRIAFPSITFDHQPRSPPTSPRLHDGAEAALRPTTFSPSSSSIRASEKLTNLLQEVTPKPQQPQQQQAPQAQQQTRVVAATGTKGGTPLAPATFLGPGPPASSRAPAPTRTMSSTRTATTATTSRHRPGPSSGSTTSRSDSKERERDRERAAAAARQAEKETWQRTRGAGSSVLHLYQDPTKSSTSWTEADVLPTLADIEAKTSGQLLDVPSLDLLLSRGIADYTILPKVLGRGKFSTVFMASRYGQLSAIKHTALFPHHQLISTRLLREPTLLAELPPHPNLVEVKETIRTPGHFYLVEEYLGGYVTLEALIPRLAVPGSPRQVLPLAAANTILMQLLSSVRAIHHPLQICHRDIKPENILVHPDTLQLKLLDFGLATHYSKSEAKLTTCCGSPAFHCPEIVRALASQPGTATYWGPEVDAWTCGVTMLRVLTGVRYPLGSNHSSLRNMAIRAQRAVAQIPLFDESATAESGLGVKVRDTVAKLLEMDAVKRMRYFEAMAVETDQQVQPDRTAKSFKSTTFVPTEPAHKMDLPLLSEKAAEKVTFPQEQQQPGAKTPAAAMTSYFPSVPASRRTTPTNSRAPSPAPLSRRGSVEVVAAKEQQQQQAQQQQQQRRKPRLIMLNPSNQPPQRVLSFIKYCLRCAGILYHCWPDAASSPPSTTAHRNSWASGAPLSPRPTSSSPDGLSSPPMMPFPLPSTAFDEPRKDGWAHVQLFECVIEYREPPSADERGGASGEAWATGGRGLVQSIMAAFGRKAAPELKRSESQPSLSPAARVKAQGANGAATNGTATPTSSTSPSSANGIKGLSFHVIVRFPKPPPRASSRPSASRTNTLQQEKRARASSVANAAAASTLFEGGEELVKTATTPTPTTPAPAAEASPPALTTITGSPEFSAPSAGPATSAAAATAAATVAVASKAPLAMTPAPAPALPPTPTPTKRSSQMAAPALPPVTAGLSIDTQPKALALRTPVPQTPLTTPSRSRKQSKAAASASAAASAAAARKILIEVSDERALPALRLALAAVGGTTDVVDWVDFAVGGGSTATAPHPPLAHRSLSMFGTASGSSSGGASGSSSSGGHHHSGGGYDSGHATPNGALSEDGEPFVPTTGDSRKYATVAGPTTSGKPPRAARSQSYFGPRAAAMVAGGARSSMDSTGTTSSLASRGQQMGGGGAATPGKGVGGATTPVRRGTSLSSMATLEVASGEREGERGHERAGSVDALGGGTPRASAARQDEEEEIERGRGLTRVSPTTTPQPPTTNAAMGSPESCFSAAAVAGAEKKQADSTTTTTLAC